MSGDGPKLSSSGWQFSHKNLRGEQLHRQDKRAEYEARHPKVVEGRRENAEELARRKREHQRRMEALENARRKGEI